MEKLNGIIDFDTIVFDCNEEEAIILIEARYINGNLLNPKELKDLNEFRGDWVYELFVERLH